MNIEEALGSASQAWLRAFVDQPLPKYDGKEPSEFELHRINKLMAEERFSELSREHQRWVTHRLLPSLVRFGTYPPPMRPSVVAS